MLHHNFKLIFYAYILELGGGTHGVFMNRLGLLDTPIWFLGPFEHFEKVLTPPYLSFNILTLLGGGWFGQLEFALRGVWQLGQIALRWVWLIGPFQ